MGRDPRTKETPPDFHEWCRVTRHPRIFCGVDGLSTGPPVLGRHNSLISWRSKKQIVVARSSTEAEYRALAATTTELIWLHWLLQDLGVDSSTATKLHCDNRSVIQIAHNDIFHERTNTTKNNQITDQINWSVMTNENLETKKGFGQKENFRPNF